MSVPTYFAYARHALVAGLRHLDIQPGEIVGLPELICRDVLSSINAVEAVPRFYPVTPDLRPLSSGNATSARVVLAVNYFGFPQDLSDFERLWPDAQLIEDNAHGLLSADVEGRSLGSRTSVGITSFRKTIRVPEGAILNTIRPIDPTLIPPLSNVSPGFAFQMRSLLRAFEAVSKIPTFEISRITTRLMRQLLTGSPLPKSTADSEFSLPELSSVSQFSLTRLQGLKAKEEIARRRHLYEYFAQRFDQDSGRQIFSDLPANCSPYGFPFYAERIPRKFLHYVRKQRCEVIRWPDLPAAVEVPANHPYKNLYVVNFL